MYDKRSSECPPPLKLPKLKMVAIIRMAQLSTKGSANSGLNTGKILESWHDKAAREVLAEKE